MSPKKKSYDAILKKLFSLPELVVSLVKCRVPQHIADSHDFSTLAPFPGEYVTREYRLLMNDLVWKVMTKDGSPYYVALMLEFQSTVCHDMAFRILRYSVNLIETIRKREKMSAGDPWPRVLPIVAYNGKQAWNAPTGMAELFGCGPGEDTFYLPIQGYYLLDEERIPLKELKKSRELVSYWVRLGRLTTPGTISSLLNELTSVLRDMHCREEVVADFSECVRFRAEQQLNISIPAGGKPVRSPMDVDKKMNRSIARIEKKAMEKGIAQGKAEGKAEGRLEGKAEAMAENARSVQTLVLYILEERFGKVRDSVESCILSITDTVRLLDLANSARKLDGIDEFERLLSPSS